MTNTRSIARNNNMGNDASDMHNSSTSLIKKSKNQGEVGKSTASVGGKSKFGRSSDEKSSKGLGTKKMDAEEAKNALITRNTKVGGVYDDQSGEED